MARGCKRGHKVLPLGWLRRAGHGRLVLSPLKTTPGLINRRFREALSAPRFPCLRGCLSRMDDKVLHWQSYNKLIQYTFDSN